MDRFRDRGPDALAAEEKEGGTPCALPAGPGPALWDGALPGNTALLGSVNMVSLTHWESLIRLSAWRAPELRKASVCRSFA